MAPGSPAAVFQVPIITNEACPSSRRAPAPEAWPGGLFCGGYGPGAHECAKQYVRKVFAEMKNHNNFSTTTTSIDLILSRAALPINYSLYALRHLINPFVVDFGGNFMFPNF